MRGKNMLTANVGTKPMKTADIQAKARGLGINPANMKKADLIHSIQRAEHNTPCYGTSKGQCQHTNCCFIVDCLKIK